MPFCQLVRTNPSILTITGHKFSDNPACIISVLAVWHPGMVLLSKEVAVWFEADPESTSMPV